MKKLTYTLLITFFSVSAWSQSEQLFTHYMFNQLHFNPAYAGSKEVLDVGAIYRNQWWSGIDGSPKSVNVYGHIPFAKRRNGIGLNLLSDKIGLHRILAAGLSYAYRIRFKNKNTLALGLGARFENARADWTKANSAVKTPDNYFFGEDETTRSTFNVGPGIYFTNPNFYVGFSIPRMLANSLYFDDKGKFSGKVNTYYAQGGVIIPASRSGNFKLYPNLQVRYNPHTPFDFDANLNLLFYDFFMIGANYRYEDSIDGLIRFQFKNGLLLSFAMDFTASELQKATTGSYEIMLGYTFPCPDCQIKNLRYF
jgi:type IX secretion system PorP/SprF family membrane protein